MPVYRYSITYTVTGTVDVPGDYDAESAAMIARGDAWEKLEDGSGRDVTIDNVEVTPA